MNLYTAEEIAAARGGRPMDHVAVWRAAMVRACAEGRPHYRRYVDPRTGRTLAALSPCDHPAPAP